MSPEQYELVAVLAVLFIGLSVVCLVFGVIELIQRKEVK